MITAAKREYNRAYYAAHREQLIEAEKFRYRNNQEAIKVKAIAFYHKNRERLLLQKKSDGQRPEVRARKKKYNAQYRQENLAKLKVNEKAWRLANRERVNASNRAYWKKHPDKFRAWQRSWVSRNQGKVNAYDAKRNAQELAATIDPVAAQWFYEIVHNQEFLTCAYCSKTITPKHAHVDHIIPVSRGGEHGPNNFCVACSTCNQSKSDDMLHEWKKLPERVKPLLEFV